MRRTCRFQAEKGNMAYHHVQSNYVILLWHG